MKSQDGKIQEESGVEVLGNPAHSSDSGRRGGSRMETSPGPGGLGDTAPSCTGQD